MITRVAMDNKRTNQLLAERLLSPSILFTIVSVVFFLIAAPLLHHKTPGSQHVVAAISTMPSFPLANVFNDTVKLVPASYPLFAVLFALWPRITKRSLDAVLGRWQVILSTAPAIICVLVSAIMIGADRGGAIDATHGIEAPSLSIFVSFHVTVTIVVACWLLSLTLFAANVSHSLNRRLVSRR